MNKLVVFFVLASIIALSWAFPKEERSALEGKIMGARDEMKKRSSCTQAAIAALKHYGIKVDPAECGTKSKRFEGEFSSLLRRRELNFAWSHPSYLRARGFGACCSPDCDWLLSYLEIDSTVVKCVDKK